MPRVYKSCVIDAPVERVWPIIRDFGGIGKYGPIVETCTLESGTGDQVGAVRVIKTKDGGVIRERLIELSDHEQLQRYAILESGLGVTDYVGTLRASPVTDGNKTFVQWYADFTCHTGREAELIGILGEGVFGPGLQLMKTLV